MIKKLLSEKGLSLVELLLALALMTVISIGIMAYLTRGLYTYKKINEEIQVHDTANYILNVFENEIIGANKADYAPSSECAGAANCQLIVLGQLAFDEATGTLSEKKTTIGFKNGQAVIKKGNEGEPPAETVLHSSRFAISDDSAITLSDGGKTNKKYVHIKLKLKDTESKAGLETELETRISYVDTKVD